MSTGSYPFLDIAKQYNCDYALVLNCAELITHGNWQEFLDFHRQSAWHGELAGGGSGRGDLRDHAPFPCQ